MPHLVQRVYKYRLYPTAFQTAALDRTLYLLRQLYNAALQERIDAWKKQRISVTRKAQDQQIKAVREADEDYSALHFHLLQDVTLRCDLAFKAFFRRVKSGETPGFPRFKGHGSYNSFAFKDAVNRNGAALVSGGKRLRIHGIGNVKIKLHRAHEGTLKQVRILRRDGHWYADFVCTAVLAKPLPVSTSEVGIDLGITTFAALSDGSTIQNPKHARAAANGLADAQRRLARCQKRSKRRRKAALLVAKHYGEVRRQRLDFHHKAALSLVQRHQLIVVENLNVKGLASGMLARSVNEAGWAQFLAILAYKAESAGRELVRVNPAGTSQMCSACDAVVPKKLSVRVHRCPCGYEADRDVNAAKNVLRLGQSLRSAA